MVPKKNRWFCFSWNSISRFQERVKAWQAWQSATAALTKKREAKVKAELQQKNDRVLVLRQEIADHERQQVHGYGLISIILRDLVLFRLKTLLCVS